MRKILEWIKDQFKIIDNEEGVELFKKAHKFPCSEDECLVRVACTQACEKIIIDEKELMKQFMKYSCCPDCGSESFQEGPSGGMSQNVRCSGCGHHFNWALPVTIERIHIGSNGEWR